MSESKPFGVENVVILHGKGYDTSAYLVLGYFDAEHLLVRESQLVEHKHVAVVLLELLCKVQRINRRQLHRLRVCGLDLLLVCELHTHLGDVVCYLRSVLKGIVDEEIITYRIDVVDNSLHAVGFRHHLIVFSTAAIYGPGVTCHFRLRHGYLRIDVGVQPGVWHTVDRGGP